jgi:hypothetical protein
MPSHLPELRGAPDRSNQTTPGTISIRTHLQNLSTFHAGVLGPPLIWLVDGGAWKRPGSKSIIEGRPEKESSGPKAVMITPSHSVLISVAMAEIVLYTDLWKMPSVLHMN